MFKMMLLTDALPFQIEGERDIRIVSIAYQLLKNLYYSFSLTLYLRSTKNEKAVKLNINLLLLL